MTTASNDADARLLRMCAVAVAYLAAIGLWSVWSIAGEVLR